MFAFLQGQLQLRSLDLSDSLAAPLPTDHLDHASEDVNALERLDLNSTHHPAQHSIITAATQEQPDRGTAATAAATAMFEAGGQGQRLDAACTHSSSGEAAMQQLYAASLRAALVRLPGLKGEERGQGKFGNIVFGINFGSSL